MGPRFVDINADKYSDLIVSGYDGVVQIGYGSAEGFAKAVRINDRDGDPVAISKYYDWTEVEGRKKGWQYQIDGSKAHGTAVCPIDWDADGDFDLLLGDSGKGGLYVRMNEGTASAPKFATKSIRVKAGGKPVHIKSLVSDALTVDWNDDGLFDIVVGGLMGGVYLLENTGKLGSPKFSAPTTLIEQADKKTKPKRMVTVATYNNQPVQPGTAIQLAVVDYDKDGKLDLLAGGRSVWMLDVVDGMTEADKESAAKMQKRVDKISAEVEALYAKVRKAETADRAELAKKAGLRTADARHIDRKIRKLKEKDSPRRRGDFVWLFKGK